MITRPPNRGVGRWVFDDPAHPPSDHEPIYDARFRIDLIPPGKLAQVLRLHRYRDADGREHLLPAGLVFDGSSQPQVTESIVGGHFDWPNGMASGYHDLGFRLGEFAGYTFDSANLLFGDVLALCGASQVHIDEMLAGVSSPFGFAAWEANAKKRQACGDLSIPANLRRLLGWWATDDPGTL